MTDLSQVMDETLPFTGETFHGIKTPKTVEDFRENLLKYFFTFPDFGSFKNLDGWLYGSLDERVDNRELCIRPTPNIDVHLEGPGEGLFQPRVSLIDINSISDIYEIFEVNEEGSPWMDSDLRVCPYVQQNWDIKDFTLHYMEVTPVSQTTEDLRKNGPKPTGPPHKVRMNYWNSEKNFRVPPDWDFKTGEENSTQTNFNEKIDWCNSRTDFLEYGPREWVSLVNPHWEGFFKMTLGDFYDPPEQDLIGLLRSTSTEDFRVYRPKEES